MKYFHPTSTERNMNLPNECRMDSLNESLIRMEAPPTKYSLSYTVVSMSGGLLLAADILCLLLAASLGAFFYTQWMAEAFCAGFRHARNTVNKRYWPSLITVCPS